ncbi:MAG: helix-turn-helix domain-containing protein [Aquabacterium sp.]
MGLAGLKQVDAGQRTAGQLLRAERERHGLTIEQLSSVIKVAPTKIEALEADRIDHLADANYTRALAQTICRALRMDASPVLKALPAAQPARLHDEHAPLNQPLPQSGVSPLFSVRGVWGSAALITRRKWFLPLCILTAAAAVWWWPTGWSITGWLPVDDTSLASAPEQGASWPAESAAVPAMPQDDAAPASAQVISPVVADPASAVASDAAAQSTASAAASAAAATGTVVSPAGSATAWPVTLRASDASWVELKEVGSGRQVFGRLMQPGETVELTGQSPMTLVVGNAQAISLQVRGRPVDLTPHVRNNVARLELQ